MKAVVAAFNQEKALVGAFSVITNLRMELFEALVRDVRDLADKDGEIHKVDFILHIKNSHLLKHFEQVDPLSRIHWKKKADLAFRLVQCKVI